MAAPSFTTLPSDALDLLQRRKPKDAYMVLAYTMEDLQPLQPQDCLCIAPDLVESLVFR